MGQHAGLAAQRERIRLGIRGKVATLLTVVLLIALTLSTLLTLHGQQQDLYAEHDRRGHEVAQLTARLLANDVASSDSQGLELSLQDLIRHSGVVYARVQNVSGITLATVGAPAGGPSTSTASFGEEIRLNGDTVGRLVVALSTEQVEQTLARRQRELLGGQLLVILSVLTVGLVTISKLILRPLAVIAGAVRVNARFDRPRFDPVPLDRSDEFGELAQGFNILGSRLNEVRQSFESHMAADQELCNAHRRLEIQTEELRERNRELERHSLTDPLTGLYNHRFFEMLMDTEVERCVRNDETISILLINVDNLQTGIEQAGHHGGDDLIRGIARVIADHTRASDVSCRYDSSGFFMLCRRATIANAVALADDLQRDLAGQPYVVHGRARHVAASIGVATAPGVHRVTGAQNLFEHADEALRHGRQTGRAVVHYSMLERPARPATM